MLRRIGTDLRVVQGRGSAGRQRERIISGLLYVQVRKPAGHDTTRPRREHDIRNAAGRTRPATAPADGSGPAPYRHAGLCPACGCGFFHVIVHKSSCPLQNSRYAPLPCLCWQNVIRQGLPALPHFRTLTGSIGQGTQCRGPCPSWQRLSFFRVGRYRLSAAFRAVLTQTRPNTCVRAAAIFAA